ncbi:hypothetical protein [Streptomyces sp. HB132]|uniref:hypothetical protein n=1 Tax=Streptomyces sp. HB132 TaxID=767388 RepID=UPI001960C3E6|nr:hypothetical protein [Streptomyces sp. HB132]MBM7442777.1 hypothetical protein [Streptomyces sp. HB132]
MDGSSLFTASGVAPRMSRYRRAAGTALLVVAAFAVGGRGSATGPTTAHTSAVTEDGTESAAPADEPNMEAAPTDEATEDDASLEDALAAAGVDADLVNQLGEIGDANDYGLGEGVETTLEDRRGLAAVQVTACRNVAVGYRTWEGLRYGTGADEPSSSGDLTC